MLALFTTFVIGPLIGLYRAWVLTLFWGWYIVSSFGLPAMSLLTAYGIVLIVSCFTFKQDATKVALTFEVAISQVVSSLLATTIFLFYGWAAHAIFS